MRHTPAPWHYSEEVSRHGTRLVFGPDNHLVADAGRVHQRTDVETEANARLIAAAPDLLKKLETAIAWIEGLPDRINVMLDDPSTPMTHELLPQLRAAIAKASPTAQEAKE